MLLARMAEAIYWAGRYLERAECTARIVQVHTDTHVDMPVGEDVGWEPLLAIAGVDSEFAERYHRTTEPGTVAGRRRAEEDVIEFLLHGDDNPSSILGARRHRPREPPHRPAGRPPRGVGGRQQPVAGLLRPPRRGRHPGGAGPVAPPGHRRLPEDQRHSARAP